MSWAFLQVAGHMHGVHRQWRIVEEAWSQACLETLNRHSTHCEPSVLYVCRSLLHGMKNVQPQLIQRSGRNLPKPMQRAAAAAFCTNADAVVSRGATFNCPSVSQHCLCGGPLCQVQLSCIVCTHANAIIGVHVK